MTASEKQTQADAETQLAQLRLSLSSIRAQADQLNWRTYMQALSKSDPAKYRDRIQITDKPLPLSPDEQAYYQAWLNPPKLSANLMHFFDTYVHDSRAGFRVPIIRGLYLTRRLILDPSGEAPVTARQSVPDAVSIHTRGTMVVPEQTRTTQVANRGFEI
jgi:hypothetical protein